MILLSSHKFIIDITQRYIHLSKHNKNDRDYICVCHFSLKNQNGKQSSPNSIKSYKFSDAFICLFILKFEANKTDIFELKARCIISLSII